MVDKRIETYHLDLLTGGTAVDSALVLFKSACNNHDTLFITDSWFGPREDALRSLLSDPITADHAEALRQAALEDVHIDDVIRWLDNYLELSWGKFLDVLRQEAVDRDIIEAERAAAELKRIREWADTEVERMRREPRPACPRCKRDVQVVPLVYGNPGEETIELGRRGAIVLGGCVLGSDRWFCKECENGFE